MRKSYTILLLVFILTVMASTMLTAQGSREMNTQQQKPIVAVSILPQAYFVDTLAHDLVRTLTLVGEGQNPHAYEPSPSQMAQLSQARLWILSGTDFEFTLKDKIRSLYPALPIIDGTKGMTFRLLEEHDHHDDHDHHHDEHDMNIDRHTWLGWQQSTMLLANTRDALVALLGDHESLIRERAQTLQTQIDAVFTTLQADLVELEGTVVYVYHPSFGYFLDSFGIEQRAVETGGKEPTARDLASLIAEAKAAKARVIFVQKQFPVTSARTVAQAVGAKVVALDPLAYDFLENIKQMGQALLEVKNTYE